MEDAVNILGFIAHYWWIWFGVGVICLIISKIDSRVREERAVRGVKLHLSTKTIMQNIGTIASDIRPNNVTNICDIVGITAALISFFGLVLLCIGF